MDYFVKRGESTPVGPFSKEVLHAMLDGELLSSEDLVRSSEEAEWAPLRMYLKLRIVDDPSILKPEYIKVGLSGNRNIEAHGLSPQQQIGIVHGETDRELVNQVLIDTPSPWPRFFAKLFDWTLLLFLVLIVLVPIVVAFPRVFSILSGGAIKTVAISCVFTFAFCLLEAILIWRTGTTFGKRWIGLKVVSSHSKDIEFWQSMRRSLSCFVFGQGLGIGIIAIVAAGFAYREITKSGTTYWDDLASTKVIRTRSISTVRGVSFGLTLFMLSMIFVITSALGSCNNNRGYESRSTLDPKRFQEDNQIDAVFEEADRLMQRDTRDNQ